MKNEDRLLDSLLGPPGSAGRAKLEAHVRSCPSCQQAFETFARLLPEMTDDDLRELGRSWRHGGFAERFDDG